MASPIWSISCLIFAFTNVCVQMACATPLDERVSVRLEKAVAFAGNLLDRELTFASDWARCDGRIAFDTQDIGEAFGGQIKEVGALRSDRSVFICDTYQAEKFSSEKLGQRIKIMVDLERIMNINYVEEKEERIEALTEYPLAVEHSISSYASGLGDGIWFGYLAGGQLLVTPEMIREMQWKELSNGTRVSGVFKDWQLDFFFKDGASAEPLRMELRSLSPSKDAIVAERFEFADWGTLDGINHPVTVVHWALVDLKKGGWRTDWKSIEVRNVGGKIEIGDRYADYFVDIPDGERAYVGDYTGIEFAWEGGELVRKYDKAKLSSLLSNKFRGSSTRKLFLILTGVLALAITGSLVWRRRNGIASSSES